MKNIKNWKNCSFSPLAKSTSSSILFFKQDLQSTGIRACPAAEIDRPIPEFAEKTEVLCDQFGAKSSIFSLFSRAAATL